MAHRIGIALAAVALVLGTASSLVSAQPAGAGGLADKVKALEARVAKLEAQDQTNTQAIAEISTRLAEIEQQLSRLSNLSRANPVLIKRVDANAAQLQSLASEIETLRTQIADLEQPSAGAGVGGGGGGAYDGGFVLVGGDFSLVAYGYLQTQWLLRTPSSFDSITENTFRIRRARLGAKGNLGSIFGKGLRYKLMFDMSKAPSLRDAVIELKLMPQLAVQAGQRKLPFTRSFITSSRRLLFPERPVVIEDFRYDRDIGVWAAGSVADGRLGYVAGVSNGGGPNRVNDNIDLVALARVDVSALGEPFGFGFGDQNDTQEPSLMVGAGALHDLVRLPDAIGGIQVGNRDVDNDQLIDNVRVVSASADAVFRYRGLELYAEGVFRLERWGTILQHSDNSDLAAVIDAGSDGDVTYFGGVGQASYFVWPETVAVGARAGYSETTLFGVDGRQKDRVPPGNRLLELDAVAVLYHNTYPLLSAQYTFTNFDNTRGAEVAGDKEHRFLVQGQLAF